MKISDQISSLKKDLEKYEFLAAQINDLTYNQTTKSFSSNIVNKNYTHYDFIFTYSNLFLQLNIQIDYDGEIIKIYSKPTRNKLAYIDHLNKKIKFCRLAANLKNRKFRQGDLLSECQNNIYKFIEKKDDYSLDTTHLDPRLKILVNFR